MKSHRVTEQSGSIAILANADHLLSLLLMVGNFVTTVSVYEQSAPRTLSIVCNARKANGDYGWIMTHY